jgi:zinc transporter
MVFDLQTPGFICAFHFHEDRIDALTEHESIVERLGSEGFIWLHLALSDSRCPRWLREKFGIASEMAASFCRPTARQYLREDQGWLVGNVSDFLREFDMDSPVHAWLHVLANSRILITGRSHAVQSAERLRQQIGTGRAAQSPVELLGQILANYPDTLDSMLHRLLGELERIEDHVLEERHHGERRRLMLLRREAAQLHRHMRALRRTLVLAERQIVRSPPQLAAIISRLASHDQDFEDLERRARFFHDEINAKLAAETNRQLYILSVLTAFFLPPSLVAALFGMNALGSPLEGSRSGFWLAVALCVLSSLAVCLFLFRLNRN